LKPQNRAETASGRVDSAKLVDQERRTEVSEGSGSGVGAERLSKPKQALELASRNAWAAKALELETENAQLKAQLAYAETTPASAVAAEVTVTRENNEALGLMVADLTEKLNRALVRAEKAERELAAAIRALPEDGT